MSQYRVYKFSFTADIKTVTLALKFPCVVSTIWKRGQKASEVKERKQIRDGIITFNEKLTIQCNMQYDEKKKVFEEKKTKFTILIFSQKGNKQAGQVYLDVAEILNKKQQCMKYQKSLEKCPDKNAKLTFQLTATFSNEIKQDQISMASTKTYDIEAAINETKPDFKKKKKETAIDGHSMSVQKKHTPQGQSDMSAIKQRAAQLIKAKSRSQKQIGQTNLSIPKENVAKISYLKLQQENKRLLQELNELKQLQIQNENLKRQFEEEQKKNVSYYKKKYEELRKQYQQYKEINIKNQQMLQKRNLLEQQMCQCKQRMGRIVNFALLSGNSQYGALIEDFQEIKKTSNISKQNAGRQSKKGRSKR